LYKISPPDIKRQIETKMGLEPSQDEPVTLEQAKTAKELHTVIKGKQDMELATADQTQKQEAANEGGAE
jgi:hypothetical protein